MGADVDRAGLDEVAATQPAGRYLPLFCDVTDEASVANCFAHVRATTGGLDDVVNAAGIAPAFPLVEAKLHPRAIPTVAVPRERLIRRLIRDLQEGKAPPQPQQVEGAPVRTYGQDSVMKLPMRNSEDDRKYLKRVGKAVMQMQFDAEAMDLSERDAHIIAQLKEMEASGFE